jgi:hypothetical protein
MQSTTLDQDRGARVRKQLAALAIGLLLAAATLLASGCASSKALLLARNGPYEATVLPVGPPTWTYIVRTDAMDGMVSVELITAADLSDCRVVTNPADLKARQQKTDQGLLVELNAQELRGLEFSVVGSGHKNGMVYLKVKNSAGITKMLGPLSGPA